jgi:hypothetical protein
MYRFYPYQREETVFMDPFESEETYMSLNDWEEMNYEEGLLSERREELAA